MDQSPFRLFATKRFRLELEEEAFHPRRVGQWLSLCSDDRFLPL